MPSWDNTRKQATKGAAVVDAAALTAPATFSATFTPAESTALRADVAALQLKLNALLLSLRNGGVI